MATTTAAKLATTLTSEQQQQQQEGERFRGSHLRFSKGVFFQTSSCFAAAAAAQILVLAPTLLTPTKMNGSVPTVERSDERQHELML